MTTAFPVKMVDFPAVTICSQGMNEDVFATGMINSFLKFLKTKKGIAIPGLTPILAENLIYSKVNVYFIYSQSNYTQWEGLSGGWERLKIC
jgi:hypothetical protein